MSAPNGEQPNEQPNGQTREEIQQRVLFCPTQQRTARELLELDKEARELVWADMAGHGPAIHYRLNAESTELFNDRLKQLDDQIRESESEGKAPFYLAVEQDAVYAEREKIKFLRATDFDPATSADRILLHFALKRQLFGDGKVGRDIRLSDFSQDDMEALRAGPLMTMPGFDHAGRRLFFSRYKNYVYKERENLLRAWWFVVQVASQDEISQRIGFVSISYQIGEFPVGEFDFETSRQVALLVKSLPIRICGLYICYSEEAWEPVVELSCHFMNTSLRVRSRTIVGSHDECILQLEALGIPRSSIPMMADGTCNLQSHWSWIRDQWNKEGTG